jgi:hypothetical protein
MTEMELCTSITSRGRSNIDMHDISIAPYLVYTIKFWIELRHHLESRTHHKVLGVIRAQVFHQPVRERGGKIALADPAAGVPW